MFETKNRKNLVYANYALLGGIALRFVWMTVYSYEEGFFSFSFALLTFIIICFAAYAILMQWKPAYYLFAIAGGLSLFAIFADIFMFHQPLSVKFIERFIWGTIWLAPSIFILKNYELFNPKKLKKKTHPK